MYKKINFGKEDKIFLILLTGLIALYFLPFLTSYLPYNDDFYRIFKGNSWDDDGRLLPSLIIRFLGHSSSIYNPAPLPMVLSIVTCGFGSFLLKKLYIDNHDPYSAALMAFGFVFNPFLLLAMSFQMDCLGFSLSLVLLIIPFIFAVPDCTRQKIKYHCYSALCIFLSLNCFQTSLGFFMALATIEVVYGVYKNDNNIKLLFGRMFQLVLGFVVYKLFLKLPFIANIARRPGRTEFVEFSTKGLNDLGNNFLNIVRAILDSFSQMQIIILGILVVLSLLFILKLYRCNRRAAKIKNADRLLFYIAIFSPFLIFLFSFLPMCFINFPILGKRYMLTSFSGFTFFLFITAGWYLKKQRRILLVLVPIIISAFGFSYNMFNLLECEYEFHKPIVAAIAQDINSASLDNKATLYVGGNLGRSRYFKRVEKNFPIVNDFRTNHAWAVEYQLSFSGCYLERYKRFTSMTDVTGNDLKNMPILTQSHYYKIYRHGRDLILILNN
ncbi:glucosyltransferase domain-containing protein [Maridesulfovibrio bastinii]|uniref:glucosyltransferase domain-containing protein n=1 Tax=Maridesulfovibrio bastinii TaxID=47157 RepID=UPI000483F988|nr:glucosyltransferase domain-containing protein [Maridesulfovibrio bastinii]